MLNMEVPIQLPAPQRRSRGRLIDVATDISLTADGRERLGAGVVHVPWGCDAPFLGNAELCVVSGEMAISVEDFIITGATDVGSKDEAIRDYPDQVVHPPFKVVDGLRCTALSAPHDTTPTASIGNRLRARDGLWFSAMMTAELVSGQASGGPSLDSEATSIGAVADMPEAAVAIESWLAGTLGNGVGAVVLPVGLLSAAVYHGWVDMATLRTVTGHWVIADAGFTGDPTDPTNPQPSAFTIYGMGLPGQAYSNGNLLDVASGRSHVDITDNVVSMILESYAQLAFEPCSVGEVTLSGS